MKKLLYLFASIFVFSLVFTSCETEEGSFNEAFLIGKWKSGTLYYKYQATGTGSTWDTADDVTEEEGLPFTWTLSGAELEHIYILELGATVPKVYTVTKLTLTSLEYEDDFGQTFSFSKVL